MATNPKAKPATTKTVAVAKPATEIAVVEEERSLLSAPDISNEELADLVEGVVENFTRDDIKVPFVKILQSMSPQLDPETADYLEDAKVGLIFNTATGTVYPENITVVPVKYMRNVTLWKPRNQGGGLIRDYGTDTRPLAKAIEGVNGRLVDDKGNEFLDSAFFFCLLLDGTDNPKQIVVVMHGKSWKAARAWNTRLDALEMPVGTKVARNLPLYMSAWELSTQYEKNDKGAFYKFAVPTMTAFTVNLPHGRDLAAHARALRLKIDAGEVRAADLDPSGGSDEDVIPF